MVPRKLPPERIQSGFAMPLYRCRSVAVRLPSSDEGNFPDSDISSMIRSGFNPEPVLLTSLPWAMQMRAISAEEPAHLVQTLTGAILGCGGWVLSRGANDIGMVSMMFEFERQICVEIYTVLIAAGLELSQAGHTSFTELCQCTRSRAAECATEIASVDLEIQTFPVEMIRVPRPVKAV
jgi:hypothetical protein